MRCGWCNQTGLSLVPLDTATPNSNTETVLEPHTVPDHVNTNCEGYMTWVRLGEINAKRR